MLQGLSGSTSVTRETLPILWALVLSPVCLYAFTILYRLSLHPLARIPGPKCGAASNFWLALQYRNGRAAQLGRYLHCLYGPVVRVGPNEVWFNGDEAFKIIYATSNGFDKSDFYLSTAFPKPELDWLLRPTPLDTLDLLSETDMTRYRYQRRCIGPVYSSANLTKFDLLTDKVITQVLARLKQLEGVEVDLREWMHIVVVECLGAAVLSWSPGLLKRGSDGDSGTQAYLSWRRRTVFGVFPLVTKLSFLSPTLGKAFGWLWGVNFPTPKGFRPFFPGIGKQITKRLKTSYGTSADPFSAHKDLAADLIRMSRTQARFNEDYLRRMLVTNFGAGHETMTSALTSIMVMIATYPESQHEIYAEAQGHLKDPAFPDAGALSFTSLVIKEAMRLHPVIGSALTRRVPEPGWTIQGYFIPANTTVGCNPIALSFNPMLCGADPEKFKPLRWMHQKLARTMERHSLVWGGGARTCPGRRLAEMIIFKLVPALVRDFEIQVKAIPDTDNMPTYFMAMMSGVKARFLPRHENGAV